MNTWIAITFAALLYGAHNIFTKLAAGKVSDAFGGLLLESTAAVLILLFALKQQFSSDTTTFRYNTEGVLFSMCAGVCVGIGTLLFFYIFSRAGELSVAGPVVLAGGVALMALAGMVIFGETISIPKLAGLGMCVAGIWLLKMS